MYPILQISAWFLKEFFFKILIARFNKISLNVLIYVSKLKYIVAPDAGIMGMPHATLK